MTIILEIKHNIKIEIQNEKLEQFRNAYPFRDLFLALMLTARSELQKKGVEDIKNMMEASGNNIKRTDITHYFFLFLFLFLLKDNKIIGNLYEGLTSHQITWPLWL